MSISKSCFHMQYEIQKINNNYDSDVIIPIWKEALPDLDERRIKWSYEENPDGKAKLYLLHDFKRHQYFGSCVVIPRNYYYKGKKIKGGITADFAIRKEYRTLGPALKLQRAIIDSNDFKILIAFPNQKAEGVQCRAGYRVFGNLITFIKIFKSAPVLKRRYNSLISFLVSPFIDVCLTIKSRGKNFSNYDITDRLDKVEQLFEEIKDKFDFIGSRSTQYLTWRFVQNPYKSYKFFSLEDYSSTYIGYIIYYIKNNIAYIVDFLCKEIYLKDLFDAFTSYCKKINLHEISLTMMENQIYLQFFKKSGFFEKVTDSKVLYFYNKGEILRDKNIFLTMGDCDI